MANPRNIYRPPSQNLKYFLEMISDHFDSFSINYDNIIIIGDFNANLICTPLLKSCAPKKWHF